jgi:small subunit ribosomal protein S6
MRNYESVIIFRSVLNDNQLRTEVAKVIDLIQNNRGSRVVVENWGKRELAYKVEKERFGILTSFRFESEDGEVVDEMRQVLKINDSVLRHQTHRLSSSERKFKGNLRHVLKEGEVSSNQFDDRDR